MRPARRGKTAVLLLVALLSYVVGVVIGRESDTVPDARGSAPATSSARAREAVAPSAARQRKAREKERARGLKNVTKQSRKVAKYAKKSRKKSLRK
ncbi:hypothetical protein [Planctomonas psychrotolerans]|uniref:hypothetical protein n=1 Tax=Planctomonas psychrotolerans TaxID=2528712 RepID=UPI001239B3B7|nr:hypothetical protein [Planctomonas psychrotolerans]